MKDRLHFIIACLMANINIACVSFYQPEIVAQEGTLYTIGLYTGSNGYSLYRDNFEIKSQKICGGRNYKILESTPWPSTLEAEQITENYTYWVIRCKK